MIISINDETDEVSLSEHKSTHYAHEPYTESVVHNDEDSWVYMISKTLSEHPTDWNGHVPFDIIKMEYNDLLALKVERPFNVTEYKKHLMCLASACVYECLEHE